MKKLILITAASLLAFASFAQTKWTVDPVHTFVNFSVGHMGISFVDGTFRKFDGSYTASKADLSDAQIVFTVNVGSITTGVEMRDNHLRSDDFFNAEKFPEMTFRSTSFKKISGNKYVLSGDLTIRDVTKPVRFDVVYGGSAKDQSGNGKTGFRATAKISRLDYNVSYDPGAQGIAKDVEITLHLEFTEAK